MHKNLLLAHDGIVYSTHNEDHMSKKNNFGCANTNFNDNSSTNQTPTSMFSEVPCYMCITGHIKCPHKHTQYNLVSTLATDRGNSYQHPNVGNSGA